MQNSSLTSFFIPVRKHSCSIFLCLISSLNCFSETVHQPGTVAVYTDHPKDNLVFSSDQARHPFLRDFIGWTLEDAGNLPKENSILVVGSSSIRIWTSIKNDLAPADIVHRGFGGSKMSQVLDMMDFFERYRCKTIVVYQGDNDLAYPPASVDRYIDECKSFIKEVRSLTPETNIHFISIKPSPARESAHIRYKAANQKIKAICDQDPKLHYIDIYSKMLDTDGNPRLELFRKDSLHMNERGYQIWTEEVRKSLGLPKI